MKTELELRLLAVTDEQQIVCRGQPEADPLSLSAVWGGTGAWSTSAVWGGRSAGFEKPLSWLDSTLPASFAFWMHSVTGLHR